MKLKLSFNLAWFVMLVSLSSLQSCIMFQIGNCIKTINRDFGGGINVHVKQKVKVNIQRLSSQSGNVDGDGDGDGDGDEQTTTGPRQPLHQLANQLDKSHTLPHTQQQLIQYWNQQQQQQQQQLCNHHHHGLLNLKDFVK